MIVEALAISFRHFLFDLFPTTCAICESATPFIRRHLCPTCEGALTRLSPLLGPLCPVCGTPTGEALGLACESCQTSPPLFASLRAARLYEGGVQKAILGFKYGGKRSLAPSLAKLFLSLPQPAWQWGEVDALVPVPMHRRRFLERGFDHSLLLALALQKEIRHHLGMRIPVKDGWLQLARPVSHQVGFTRSERKRNIECAIQPTIQKVGGKIPRKIVLLDDVYTTGATVDGCCQSLRRKFPDVEIHVIVLAKTAASR